MKRRKQKRQFVSKTATSYEGKFLTTPSRLKLSFDIICNYCASGDCENHIARQTRVDRVTNLVFDVYCICGECQSGKK